MARGINAMAVPKIVRVDAVPNLSILYISMQRTPMEVIVWALDLQFGFSVSHVYFSFAKHKTK
jgi:hypothetical protein